jgi:hypothetical protein
MINFTSKNDFKRANKMRAKQPTLPLIRQNEDLLQDDDTLMSCTIGDDLGPGCMVQMKGIVRHGKKYISVDFRGQ